MSRSRLVPGAEVVAVPGRGIALRTPEGDFLRVWTPEGGEPALLDRLAGLPTSRTDEETDRVVAAFENAGYLADAPEPPEWPEARGDVRLVGDATLIDPLAAQLTALGARPRLAGPATSTTAATELIGDLTRAAPAAVVWCLDGPVPDGLWDAADRLPERGIAWLRCHREGRQAYAEPLAVGPRDVTSAHVRGRRLAATAAHRELAAYWSGPRTTGAPVRITAPAAALLAALLADDLHRWATDTPRRTGLPARRRLRRVDLDTLTVTEHPVLPVPPVAAPPKQGG
ncbi:hypothetical protein [Streptomyces sp. WMMC905]|uniref:hypothetical protein n=1 Tax=Streptomyces sp. WMMC905 TaxID=3404123 RepID=UPI003B925EA9